MEITRGSLTEKLEALEGQVADTVSATTGAVQETTEAVKETVATVTDKVQETVQTVSETLNLGIQMERHPWLVLAGAVAAGCFAGAALGAAQENKAAPRGRSSPPPPPPPWSQAVPEAARSAEPGIWNEALCHLRDIGVSYLMGLVRDLTKGGLPGELGDRLANEVDNLTKKMGAEPIRGPVLPDWKTAGPEENQPRSSPDSQDKRSGYRGRSPMSATVY